MPSIPLTAYDIFAYVTSGFVVIAAADFAFPGAWVLEADLTIIQGFVWVGIAYIVVLVVSALSALLFEQWVVERQLGRREQVLFGGAKRRRRTTSALKWVFPGYFEALPKAIRRRVLARAKEEAKIMSVDEALFLYCDAEMRQKPEVAPVLAYFLNTYGFARNACLASIVAAGLLVSGARWHRTDAHLKLWLAAAAIAVALGLFFRYVKFFRLYARDVFLFYSTQSVSPSDPETFPPPAA